MKAYATPFIRNVGIVGHGDTGKTQLVSSLLFTAGMTPRLGKVAEGNTVTDWDEEEIARKISIQTSIAYAEWAPGGQGEKTKINFLDTPGYSTFINETRATLIAADAALVVVDALAGVQVVTEKVWDYCTEYDLPRAVVINRMDRELANFERALESVQQAFGRSVVPIQLPIGAEKSFRGLIDLVTMKALIYALDGDGRAKVEEIPADMAEAAKEAHEKLVEMVAEGDDKLMEEFFEKGTLPVEDLDARTESGFPGPADYSGPGQLGAAQHRQRRHSRARWRTFFRIPRRAAASAGPASRPERAAGRAKSKGLRAAVDFRLQDVLRSLRRPDQLLQGDVGRAAQRRQRDEFRPRDPRALPAHASHAGQERRGGPGAARRGHRRDRQTQGDADGRHAGRQIVADLLSAGAHSRAFHHFRH